MERYHLRKHCQVLCVGQCGGVWFSFQTLTLDLQYCNPKDNVKEPARPKSSPPMYIHTELQLRIKARLHSLSLSISISLSLSLSLSLLPSTVHV